MVGWIRDIFKRGLCGGRITSSLRDGMEFKKDSDRRR